MQHHLRIARPVSNLAQAMRMYCDALDFNVLGSFADHQGFDGVMLGKYGMPYHFEFTRFRATPIEPTPTHEDLIVFYIPDTADWQDTCARMLIVGFKQVQSFNPYWNSGGQTFVDLDGYRVVLCNSGWTDEPIYAQSSTVNSGTSQ